MVREVRIHGHRRGAVQRHSDAGDGRAQSRMMHNLPALVAKLLLLFGVAGIEKDIDLRDYIKRDRVRKDAFLDLLASQMRLRLARWLRLSLSPCAVNCLIARLHY